MQLLNERADQDAKIKDLEEDVKGNEDIVF